MGRKGETLDTKLQNDSRINNFAKKVIYMIIAKHQNFCGRQERDTFG